MDPRQNEARSDSQSCLAVTTGVLLSKTATAPILRMKLLIQNEAELVRNGQLHKQFSGYAGCLVRSYKDGGVRSLWRGNTVHCCSQVLYTLWREYCLTYGAQRWILYGQYHFDPYNNLSLRAKVFTALLTMDLIFRLAVYPLEYAHVRLATDLRSTNQSAGQYKFKGVLDVYAKTIKAEGLKAVYRGLPMYLTSSIVFYASTRYIHCYMEDNPYTVITIYPMLHQCVNITTGSKPNILAGKVLEYPFTTLYTRMMLTSGYKPHRYKHALDCMYQIVNREGVRALMKGFIASVAYGFSSALVTRCYRNLNKYAQFSS